MTFYVPGTEEKDPSKIIMSLQQAHEKIADNATNITTLNANKAAGAASSTDNAAARFDGTGGKTLQNSPLIIADTTGALSRNGNGGIPLQGTNTNDNASSGDVGEFLFNFNTVALTTATPADLASLSVPAGDWDLLANVQFSGAGATVTSEVFASVGTTSATMNSGVGTHARWRGPATTDLFYPMSFTIRVSLASTTAYYLTAQATFTTSTYSGVGFMRVRRVR